MDEKLKDNTYMSKVEVTIPEKHSTIFMEASHASTCVMRSSLRFCFVLINRAVPRMDMGTGHTWI